MFGKPFKVLPAGCLFVSLFVCFRWDFQTCSFEVEHIGFGTSKQTLWPKPNRFGDLRRPPLLGWSFDPPRGIFFNGWNLGIPRYRTRLEEGCIIFQVSHHFQVRWGGRARFVSLKNEIFQASFFFRDWDVKIFREGYWSWMPWIAFFFFGWKLRVPESGLK